MKKYLLFLIIVLIFIGIVLGIKDEDDLKKGIKEFDDECKRDRDKNKILLSTHKKREKILIKKQEDVERDVRKRIIRIRWGVASLFILFTLFLTVFYFFNPFSALATSAGIFPLAYFIISYKLYKKVIPVHHFEKNIEEKLRIHFSSKRDFNPQEIEYVQTKISELEKKINQLDLLVAS